MKSPRARSLCAFALGAAVTFAWSRPTRGQLLPPADDSDLRSSPKPPPVAFHPRSSLLLWVDLSLQAAALHVESSGRERTTGAALAALELFEIVNVRALETKIDLAGSVGGGGGGLEGTGKADVLFGARGYVTDKQGPFGRVGLVSGFAGNQLFSFSYAAIAGEGGYQFVDRHVGFEVGPSLGGTFAGSLLYGGFATLSAGHGLLRVQWQRFVRNGETLDVVTNNGCAVVRSIFALCLTQWSFPGETGSRATYAGVSIGLGTGVTAMTSEGKK